MKTIGLILTILFSGALLADAAPHKKRKRHYHKIRHTATHKNAADTAHTKANLRHTLHEKGFTRYMDSVKRK